MRERIPIDIPDLPVDDERREARDALLDAMMAAGRWGLEAHDRNPMGLVYHSVMAAVDTASILRLTAKLRFFLDHEAEREPFFQSLGDDAMRFRQLAGEGKRG